MVTAAGIAAGPDGKIWLGDQARPRGPDRSRDAERGGDVGLRVPASTSATLRPVPTGTSGSRTSAARSRGSPRPGQRSPFDIPGDGAWDIVAGPDGNIWYTAPEGNNSDVGRITPAGEFGTAVRPTDAGDQLGITVGPDGALWFAQAVANDIGRMTLDGDFTAGRRPHRRRPARVHRPGSGEHALVHGEGRATGSGASPASSSRPRRPRRRPPPPPPADTDAPHVTRFRITRTVFRLGGLGTVIRWRQSEAATNTIVFHRRVNGRWRRVPRRRMRFQSSAGAHRLRFRGRVSLRQPLRPGRYRMTMRARDAAGNVSTPGSGALQAAAARAPLDLRHRVLRRPAGIRRRRRRRRVGRRRLGAGRGAGAWAGRLGVHSHLYPGRGGP